MTERETESRRSKPRSRGHGASRYVYGALLVAIGACVGIVVGSLSETPRLLLERLRGPVETVELEAPADAPKSAPPLEAFGQLQTGAKPKPDRAPAAAPAQPASPPVQGFRTIPRHLAPVPPV